MKNPVLPLFSYLKASKEELEKVSWPTRRDTLMYTGIVIGLCVVLGAFFAGLDWALSLGLQKLIGLTA